jgi:hypothetical protein
MRFFNFVWPASLAGCHFRFRLVALLPIFPLSIRVSRQLHVTLVKLFSIPSDKAHARQ